MAVSSGQKFGDGERQSGQELWANACTSELGGERFSDFERMLIGAVKDMTGADTFETGNRPRTSHLDFWRASRAADFKTVRSILHDQRQFNQSEGILHEADDGDDAVDGRRWKVVLTQGSFAGTTLMLRKTNLEPISAATGTHKQRLSCLGPSAHVRVVGLHGQVRLDWEVSETSEYAFQYKNRRVTSQALHAALAPLENGEEDVDPRQRLEVIKLLLEWRADPCATACTKPSPKVRELQPIHMAAGAGDAKVISLLIANSADVEAKALHGGNFHYRPIHDAAWYGRIEAAKELLRHHARLDAVNDAGCTAVHLAAKLGHIDMVSVLLQQEDGPRLLHHADEDRKTPLDLALESCQFHPRRLYTMTQHLAGLEAAEAFMKVARACPTVVPHLLRDNDLEGRFQGSQPYVNVEITARWRQSLRLAVAEGEIQVRHLAELIEVAPDAAVDFIEVITEKPAVRDEQHHPMPLRANIPRCRSELCQLSCVYVADKAWEWDFSKDGDAGIPQWHHVLAPRDPVKGQEVVVKVLGMPGMVCFELMFSLAETPSRLVYTKLPVHALLWFTWANVRWSHTAEIATQFARIVCLVMWIWPEWSALTLGVTECITMSVSLNEILLGVLTTWKCARVLGRQKCLQWLSRTFMRWLVAGLTLGLVVSSPLGEKGGILFSTCALLQWVHFLWELRVFPVMGKRVLPMMRSLMLLGGMFTIVGFVSLGFLHAFWAIGARMENAFIILKLLFSGEVEDGLASEFIVTGRTEFHATFLRCLVLFAIFVFVIMLLNLFVAVLSDCYDLEQERMLCSLLRERAHLCCQFCLAPCTNAVFPRSYPKTALVAWVFMLLFGAALCIFLIRFSHESELSLNISAGVMAVYLILWQSLLRGSLRDSWAEMNYLWICHEASFDEIRLMVPEERGSLESKGRMTRLKKHISEQTRNLRTTLLSARSSVMSRHHDQDALIRVQEATIRELTAGVAELRRTVAAGPRRSPGHAPGRGAERASERAATAAGARSSPRSPPRMLFLEERSSGLKPETPRVASAELPVPAQSQDESRPSGGQLDGGPFRGLRGDARGLRAEVEEMRGEVARQGEAQAQLRVTLQEVAEALAGLVGAAQRRKPSRLRPRAGGSDAA